MVTVAVYAVLAVVVVAALVALAVLVLPGNEELAPAPADRTPWALPAERAMTGPDVGRLRLPVTLRGYRFAETDAVLDRLGEEIAYRDSVIATLQAELDDRSFAAPAGGDAAGGAVAGEDAAGEDAAGEDAAGEDAAVELGETPEEIRHEPVVEAGPQPEVEAAPAQRVVGIDDDLPGDDDLTPAPTGAGPTPANDLPDGDPALDEGPDGPPDDPPASRT